MADIPVASTIYGASFTVTPNPLQVTQPIDSRQAVLVSNLSDSDTIYLSGVSAPGSGYPLKHNTSLVLPINCALWASTLTNPVELGVMEFY